MIGKQVKNLLGDFKLTSRINPETFNGISKYYKNIKAEYNRMIKLGESAKIHSKHNPVKSGQDTKHPRREALLKSSSPTRLELLQLSDTELDTWFNENSIRNQDLSLGLLGDDKFSYFFPSEIHTEIHQTYNTLDTYEIKYSRRDKKTITISFSIEYCKGKALKVGEITQMQLRTLLLGALSPTPKKYSVVIYPSKIKKDFKNTSSKKRLGASNVNSGVTTIYKDNDIVNKTTVFRREELGKLLIHELIHNLEYDFGFSATLDTTIDLHNVFNVPRGSNILLNETYTETVALIINAILCNLEKSSKGGIKAIVKSIYLELIFNLFQTAKILDFYGFQNAEELNQPDDTLGRFNQSSNVLSYYYLKTAVLYNFKDFITFVDKYTTNFYIHDSESPNTQKAFVSLILKSTRNPDFLNDVNRMMDFFKKNKRGLPREIENTLRMTCIE